MELAFTALALKTGSIPMTLNLRSPEEACEALVVDGVPIFRHVLGHPIHNFNCLYALKNSFGFGGTNASIVLKKY